jgi:hypothetical protein
MTGMKWADLESQSMITQIESNLGVVNGAHNEIHAYIIPLRFWNTQWLQ